MFNFHIVHTVTARFIITIRRLCFGGALPSRPTRRAFVSRTFHVSTRRKRVVRNSRALALASHAKNKETRIAVITARLLFYIVRTSLYEGISLLRVSTESTFATLVHRANSSLLYVS